MRAVRELLALPDVPEWSRESYRRERIADATLPVCFGLLDILFAYCYDVRVFGEEHTSESGWNVSKLSATMTCCQRFDSLADCVVTCMRRALCYPLYRHVGLAKQVWADVSDLLRAGRTAVVKALLDLVPVLVEAADGRHVFNQLYVEPYATWAQGASPAMLESLAAALADAVARTTKSDVGLELEEIEQAARLVLEEEEEEKDAAAAKVSKRLGALSLDERNLAAAADSDDDSASSENEAEAEQ